MMWLRPAAFALLLVSFLIVLLHLLRARAQPHLVSAVRLWEGLPTDPHTRAARLLRRFDLLLWLQLAALLALVAALAQPMWETTVRSAAGLAVVIDGSASMRSVDENGRSRYERAVDRATSIIDRHPAAQLAVVQLSARPRILAGPDLPRPDAVGRLAGSEPTWYADGTAATLDVLLASLEAQGPLDRVVWLSDHSLPDAPAGMETEMVGGTGNLAVTGFSVRQNPSGRGVTALVTVINGDEVPHDAVVRIDDRRDQTTLSLLLPPGAEQRFVIPFPNSTGSLFTAILEPSDGFPADNRRYFSLERSIDLRVRWIGSDNRYLLAALRSVAPVLLVDSGEDADLTVVYAGVVPPSIAGTVLVVHGEIPGQLALGAEEEPVGEVRAVRHDHPLLAGVDADDLRIRRTPRASLPPSAELLLVVGDLPLLAVWEDAAAAYVAIPPDLLQTNLPVTVDFPLLIRNIVARVADPSPALAYRAAEVGEPVSVGGLGVIASLFDPSDRPILLPLTAATFRPDMPGFHTVFTDRGAFALAVNVPHGESRPPSPAGPSANRPGAWAPQALRQNPLWPIAAALTIVLLAVELYLYVLRSGASRRVR